MEQLAVVTSATIESFKGRRLISLFFPRLAKEIGIVRFTVFIWNVAGRWILAWRIFEERFNNGFAEV